MALTVKMNWEFRFFDVKTAYLYGDIKETLFMALFPGFEKVYEEERVQIKEGRIGPSPIRLELVHKIQKYTD